MPATLPEKAPAKACRLAGGAVRFASPRQRTESAYPITMLARSSQPIDHWFWGRVVHDFAGMKRLKPTLPIDYDHVEPCGYLDKFTVTSDGLLVEGALVPTSQPNDRAKSLVELSDGGVPFEASICFDDAIVVEELYAGAIAQVNGISVEGPCTIIRQWTLRGVAVCPYGADPNTSSEFSQAGAGSFSISLAGSGAAGASKRMTPADVDGAVGQWNASLVNEFGVEFGTRMFHEHKSVAEAREIQAAEAKAARRKLGFAAHFSFPERLAPPPRIPGQPRAGFASLFARQFAAKDARRKAARERARLAANTQTS